MHKVVIERPRHGRSWARSKPAPKPPFDQAPRYESMKASHTRRTWFSDLLGPLRRWLQSQVGRPWNDVYSEACAVIKPDSVIRAHVKTHLLEFVERNTFMEGGIVCVLDTSRRGGVKPVTELGGRSLFFVHPETGLLQKISQISKGARAESEPKPPVTLRWLTAKVALQQIRGLWFECHYKVMHVESWFEAHDHALEKSVTRKDLELHDRFYHLCTRKRQLSKRDLRQYGLRNSSSLFVQGTQSSAGYTYPVEDCASIFRRAEDCEYRILSVAVQSDYAFQRETINCWVANFDIEVPALTRRELGASPRQPTNLQKAKG